MRVYFKALASLVLLPFAAHSLQQEDAGVLDFVIATAGHSVTRQVSSQGDSILTTDAGGATTTSCYVASRKVDSGSLNWRRNVCSSREATSHAFAVGTSSHFYTVDSVGIARAWTVEEGNLIWDTQLSSGSFPGVWAFSIGGTEYVAAATEGELNLLNAATGSVVDTISAMKALNQKLKSKETAQWLTVVVEGDTLQGVVAFVQEDGSTNGNRVWAVTMEIGNDAFTSIKNIGGTKGPIDASSFGVQQVGESYHGLAVTMDGSSAVTFSLNGKNTDDIAAGSWLPGWTRVTAIQPTATPSMITVQGVDNEGQGTMGLFVAGEKGWEPTQVTGTNGGVAYCPDAKLVVAMGTESLKAYEYGSMSALSVTGDMFVPDGDFVEDLSVLQCNSDSLAILMSTAGGTSTQISFALKGGKVTATLGWTAEEGLASVSSAVVLDGSHLGSDDLVEEKEAVASKLSLSSRLSSQLEIFSSLFSSTKGEFSRRDHIFGFVKVVALLSQTNHRIWGVKTSGSDRGSVKWSLDLPKTASWHTMVHGTTNSPTATHGINGGTHSREILVVSASPDMVEWKCIDGTNGVVHSQESTPISSPIAQIIPVYGSAGACRQASLLLHDDLSLSVIPGDAATLALVKEQLTRVPNGMYTHFVNTATSKLESYQVAIPEEGSFVARQVGRTSFAGERIVKVAYPIRDEIIQTMTTILGDDSLLLKFINPHLAVIITVADEGLSKTNLAASMEKSQGAGPKRKPAGVGDAVAAVEKGTEVVSNLFVNLVDTVSGRVLHRASHANADVKPGVTALISENWVIYSFVNAKSRRTELGVLTLHEGMIDSKGISLFSSPEQTTSFSSLDARESKPVVLSKTYTYPKRITALGVTATRGGISSRNILIATDDGKIASIGRMMLETRRPMGEVKEVEKKEGLFAYSELIPQVPLTVLSYNQTIESVSSIVSVPTSLESQSLVMAFGGPDLFFTRTSPSRGFDLLPDSFSRVLVSIVSVGLVIVLFVVQRMGSQKILKQAWQ